MKNFLLGIISVLFVVFIVFFSYTQGQKKSSQDIPLPTAVPPVVTNSITPSDKQLVGNDRDEHGCIGSAGYVWCESKTKCLRTFEETCPSPTNDNELIKQALFTKNNWKESDKITVSVSQNDGVYASGTASSEGGGGYFYAVKNSGQWIIVADGNGVISCASLEQYPNYPQTLIPECYNEKTGETEQR